MRSILYQIIKVVHALLWFPLNPLIGPDFPLCFLFRGRRKSARTKQTLTQTEP